MAKEKELAVKETATPVLAQFADMFTKFRKSESFKKMAEQVEADTKTFGIAPRITMSKDDSSKEFKIDNGTVDEAEILVGTIVTYTKQNEYRVNKDDRIPTCSSTGAENGTLYGKCASCKHGAFIDNHKDCVSSYRLLVSVLGAVDPDKVDKKGNIEVIERFKDFKKTPFEVKVPALSIAPFKEYLKELGKKKPKHYEIDGKLTPVEVLTVFSVGKAKTATGSTSVMQFEFYGTLQDLMQDIVAGKEESVSAEEFGEFVTRTFGYVDNPDLQFELTPYKEPVNYVADVSKNEKAAPAKSEKKEEVEEAVIIEEEKATENESGKPLPF